MLYCTPFRTFEVYRDAEANDKLDFPCPDLTEFIQDSKTLCDFISDGPLKSYCYRRLCLLSSRFDMHVLLNEQWELASQKAVPHRDFYNVRKVDCHIHAAGCMNQKQLLRFIKKTMNENAEEVVAVNETGGVTLAQLFKSMNLATYDLTVDKLVSKKRDKY